MTQVYDDAREHRSRLPGDLPRKAGATHIGIFFAWCVERGLTSAWHERARPSEFARLQRRFYSGRDYLLQFMEGRLTAEHLGPAARDFAEGYFASGRYVSDYAAALQGPLPSLYHVPDTWDSVDALAPVLDERFQSWRAARFGEATPAPEPTPQPAPAPEPERKPAPRVVPEPKPELVPASEPQADPPREPLELAPILALADDEPTPPSTLRRNRWISWDPVKHRRSFRHPTKNVVRWIAIFLFVFVYGCAGLFR